MSNWILRCRHCDSQKSAPPAPEHFLYCSMSCKETHEAESLARRLEKMKTHDPENRHVKTEGELRAMGISVQVRSGGAPSQPSSCAPKKNTARRGPKKGSRKCGKCGEQGHNARTCGTRKPRLRGAEEVPRFTVGGGTPELHARPRKATKGNKKRAASKVRQNKCGECGGRGHNARTCNKI